MTSTFLKSGQRNGWLDCLRAIAIVMVVNCHIASSVRSSGLSSYWGWKALGVGGHGVDLFFVLSGWLLGGILFSEQSRTGSINLRSFYVRRWWRTLPAYYAVLSLSLLERIAKGNANFSDSCYVYFGQTFVYDELPFFGISWSLCVEEHFYLMIAPLIILIGKRASLAVIIFSCLIFAPMVFRSLGWFNHLQQTHVRIDQCAAGVTLAYVSVALPNTWSILRPLIPMAACTGTLLFIAAFFSRGMGWQFELPLIGYTAIFAAWVALSGGSDYWKTFGNHNKFVAYMATRSYSFYLVHVEAISLAKKLGISDALLYTVLVWALTFLLAEILFRFVETPGMRVRDSKLFRRGEAELRLTTNFSAPSKVDCAPSDCKKQEIDHPRNDDSHV